MVIDVDDGGEDARQRVPAMSDEAKLPDPSALVGHSIAGKFVIEALVATGGAGTVYRARQLALDRVVAIKVLRQDFARDAHFVERFKREARAASRLDHPNSVRVFDFGHIDDSLLYLAMDYFEGRTLHQVIDEDWPLADARAVDIMAQVLSAVAVAHDMGVIHRDLKPDNIMVIRTTSDDGEATDLAKVCDFGIATLGAVGHEGGGSGSVNKPGNPWATSDGSLVGTPGYMSPEQARGEAADRRSDIYSAGVILYHLLAGRPPFEGDSAYFLAMKHITDPPVPPSQIRAVNPALEAICLRALAKAPRDRFDTAREMRAALRAAVTRGAGVPSETTPAPRSTEAPRTASPDTQEMLENAGVGASARHKRVVATVAGVAALAAIAAAMAARSLISSGDRPDRPTATAATEPSVRPPARAPQPTPAPRPTPGPIEATTAAAQAVTPSQAATATHRPAHARQIRDRGLVRAAHVELAPSAPPGPAAAAPGPAAAPTPVAAPVPHSPPAAANTPPAQAPAPRIDVEHASASITGITTTSAIPGSTVRAALARVPLVRCYRDALRAGGLASGTATLRLKIDAGGYVTSATLQGGGVTPSLKSCIERAATAMRIKDVDTGDATAEVALSFVAAP